MPDIRSRRKDASVVHKISNRWRKDFLAAGVFHDEHIRLSSNLCATHYADFSVLFTQNRFLLWRVVETIFDCYLTPYARKNPTDVLFVGQGSGAHLANTLADLWVRRHQAHFEGRGAVTSFAYAERDTLSRFMVFGRHQSDKIEGRLVFVVDDVFVTGKTLTEVCKLVLANKGIVSRCITLLNRSNRLSPLLKIDKKRIAVHSLCRKHIPTFAPGTCPACKQGILFSKETPKSQEAFALSAKHDF